MSEKEQNERIREWFKKTTGLKSGYLRVHMNEIESKLKTSDQQNKGLSDEDISFIKEVCEKFINKVETGRARSRETYADLKAVLELLSNH